MFLDRLIPPLVVLLLLLSFLFCSQPFQRAPWSFFLLFPFFFFLFSFFCCPSSSPVVPVEVLLDRLILPVVVLLLLFDGTLVVTKAFYLFISDFLSTSVLINLG